MGSEISLFYDPMLAKLIVHAPTRESAIERMHRALLELTIEGIECSRDFHLRVMEDDEFRRGAIEIQWLERRLDSLVKKAPPPETARLASVIAALIAERDRNAPRRASAQATAAAPASDVWTRAARLDGLR
jgi:acetyl-CoA carboxylase biotin carboxylase subunit